MSSLFVIAKNDVSAQEAMPEPGQRIVLVTGSTGGLGREVAKSLASQGDHVIVHGRNVERGNALVAEIATDGTGSARFYRADFGSLEEIRALGAAILRDYDRLDVLVNNAGVFFPGEGERRLTDDGYEFHFQVNYLSGYILTEMLIPLLESSSPARIVNVASAGQAPLDFDNLMLDADYNGMRAYAQSKLAQIMMTFYMADDLNSQGITINALHPSTFMDTDMVIEAGYDPRTSVETGRDAVLHLINDNVGTGKYFDVQEEASPDPQALDHEALSRLMKVSEELTAKQPENQHIANYARYGADVWARNPMARRSGEGEACISCHTSLPYALVEPLLPGDYPAYTDLLQNIDNRIRTWNDNTPWYADDKLEETAIAGGKPPDALKSFLNGPDSRGVEAIFNAFIRTMKDAYAGQPASTETKLALENMWNEQKQSGPAAGRWGWIQANLVPWEVSDSDIWGASLACVATSVYPNYSPEHQLGMLVESLRQASTDPAVSLHAKAAVIWCDAESGGEVLADGIAAGIAADLLALQRDDGGWALRDIGPWVGWEGSDADCCSGREVRSDSYATGFVSLALSRNQHRVPDGGMESLEKSAKWMTRDLANPYPAGQRYNVHNSGATELPEFRDNLYSNAGSMWSFLAKYIHDEGRVAWESE
jgi:NAD(P)-dependent dehydrogenase (short-subunit alcohol dehydrogenase family)